MAEWVYESFMNKYGLKNVAEKKFAQMLASCYIYEGTVPRIKMYGKLLDIHAENEDGPFEYNKYSELVETLIHQVLNFKIDDTEDRIMIPMAKALEVYRFNFEGRIA